MYRCVQCALVSRIASKVDLVGFDTELCCWLLLCLRVSLAHSVLLISFVLQLVVTHWSWSSRPGWLCCLQLWYNTQRPA